MEEVQHLKVHVTHVIKNDFLLVSIVADQAVTGTHAPGLHLTLLTSTFHSLQEIKQLM